MSRYDASCDRYIQKMRLCQACGKRPPTWYTLWHMCGRSYSMLFRKQRYQPKYRLKLKRKWEYSNLGRLGPDFLAHVQSCCTNPHAFSTSRSSIHAFHSASNGSKCTTNYFSSSQLFYVSHVNQCFQVNGEELAADDKTIHQGRIKLNEIKTACAAIKRKKESLMVTILVFSSVPNEYTFLPCPTKSNCLLYDSRYWKEF